VQELLREPDDGVFLHLGELLRACDAYGAAPVVRAAFKVAPILPLRPGDLRFAECAEIDLDKAL